MGSITPVALLGAAACVIWLWSVCAIGWSRTAGLRRGRVTGGDAAPATGRTSRTTYLPGAAGLLLFVAGVTALAGTMSAVAIAVTGTGVLVSATGLATRVVAVEVGPQALVIRYAARRAFVLPWWSCRSLAPPRWPLGGWRVAGPRGRILMPSDLFGRERVLETIVAEGALRYRDGTWVT